MLGAAVLYLSRLDQVPLRVSPDEAVFGVQAHALATTGRDVNGTPAPLFVLITDPLIANHSSVTWWQPTLFYLTAAMFEVAPPAVWTLRLPVAMLALLNIVLTYLIARRLFVSPWYAVFAAATIAMTPAHLVLGRQATDYFCPLTFALGWFYALTRALEAGGWRWPPVTGGTLGAGLFSYITSWVVMPMYLVLSAAALWRAGHRRSLAALTAAFLAPLSVALVWLLFHPEMPAQTLQNYKVVTDVQLATRVSLYWSYFSPSYLFFSGGSEWLWTTRQAGVFLLPLLVLLPAGAWSVVRAARTRPPARDLPHPTARVVILVAFLLVPLPIVAALPEAPHGATARALLAVPFGVLLATFGLEWLLARRSPLLTLAAVGLIAALPMQFAAFARDYFTEYQQRAAFRFDPLDLAAVADYVTTNTAAAQAPAVLLDELPGGRRAMQWRWQLLVRGRDDLWRRSGYLRPEHLRDGAPPGTLLVVEHNHPVRDTLARFHPWRVAHVVHDAAGQPVSAILRRE